MNKYTKLDAQGNKLPDSAESWAMVKDNVTRFTWEVKTDEVKTGDEFIKSLNVNQYFTIHTSCETWSWKDAHSVFLNRLNVENFGGYSDWRLPTREELSSIVNKTKYAPAINVNYFPNTVSAFYWASDIDQKKDETKWIYLYKDFAWGVYFFDGEISYNRRSERYHVRGVRGEKS